jgi:hypothetical protein
MFLMLHHHDHDTDHRIIEDGLHSDHRHTDDLHDGNDGAHR